MRIVRTRHGIGTAAGPELCPRRGGVSTGIEYDLRPRIGFARDQKKESVLGLGHSPFPQT